MDLKENLTSGGNRGNMPVGSGAWNHVDRGCDRRPRHRDGRDNNDGLERASGRITAPRSGMLSHAEVIRMDAKRAETESAQYTVFFRNGSRPVKDVLREIVTLRATVSVDGTALK